MYLNCLFHFLCTPKRYDDPFHAKIVLFTSNINANFMGNLKCRHFGGKIKTTSIGHIILIFADTAEYIRQCIF